MPVQPSYPGVYIEEIPSGVRTITGVPTSIAAFVGTGPRGPDGTCVPIGSPLAYERSFGPLDASPLAVAVGLFFQNGGTQALVLRVAGAKEAASTLTLVKQGDKAIKLQALSRGAWGGNLAASVDFKTPDEGKSSYNLNLRDTSTGRIERYQMVSPNPSSPRTLSRLLRTSQLAKVVSDDGLLPARTAEPSRGSGTAPGGNTNNAAGAPPGAAEQPAGTVPPAGNPAGAPPAAPSDGTLTPPGSGAAEPTWLKFVFEGDAKDAPGPTAADYNPPSLVGGIYALSEHDVFFNMLVLVPPTGDDLDPSILAAAAKIASDRRAFLIVDAPSDWVDTASALKGRDAVFSAFDETSRRNAAVYFPRLKLPTPAHTAGAGINAESFPPAGALAGLFARTDSERGLWKAPAGIATSIGGTVGLTDVLTDFDSGQLNPVAINALRTMPIVGNVVWGARTMVGSDLEASQWKYVPIRRLALYIEESLFRGTQWVVFEPNDEPLWAQVRLNVGAFMHTLFRQGAFQGTASRDAYFVKCDKDCNPQADIDRGVVNIIVGFAPLKPAEFVIIQLQQISAPLEV